MARTVIDVNDELLAAAAEILVGLMQLRRTLDPADFLDLAGSIMVEIDEGIELGLERAHRRRPEGKVIPFPPDASPRPGNGKG